MLGDGNAPRTGWAIALSPPAIRQNNRTRTILDIRLSFYDAGLPLS